MDRSLELEQVNTALYLEEIIRELENEKVELDESKPKEPVRPPMKTPKIGQPELEPYPEIEKPSASFPLWASVALIVCVVLFFASFFMPSVIGGLLTFILIPAFPICLLAGLYFRKEKERMALEAIQNSPEYKEQCKRIAQENDARLKAAKQVEQLEREKIIKQYKEGEFASYKEELNNYEQVVLPEWKERRKELIYAKAKVKDALDDLYAQNVIPGKYRNYEALTFISAFMGTSQYDLKFAIEQYNDELHARNEKAGLDYARAQKDILQHTLEVAEYKSYLAEQTNEMIKNGNDTLRSLKRWSIASTAIQGYTALKQNQLIKSTNNK